VFPLGDIDDHSGVWTLPAHLSVRKVTFILTAMIFTTFGKRVRMPEDLIFYVIEMNLHSYGFK